MQRCCKESRRKLELIPPRGGIEAVKRFFLIGLVVLAAIAQTPIPDTPVGKVLSAWVEAVNTGQRGKLEEFQKTFAPSRTDMPDILAQLPVQTGGLDLSAVKESTADRVVATFKHRNGSGFTDVMMVASGDPPRLAGIRLSPAEAPNGTPAPRVIPLAPEALNQALDAEALQTKFNGALLVARQGRVVFQKAYGMAERQRNVANTLDTKFRLGSVNKMFTAVAVLQLVDQGKINLDAPLADYVIGYPNTEMGKATVRQLLTHTAGAGDVFTPEFQAKRGELREHSDYVKLFGARPPQFPPGTRWEYSNYGYVLLGSVIEGATGISYYDYVRRNIFQPAGMKDTDSLPESDLTGRVSVGYTGAAGSQHPNTDTLPYRGISAGGGYSTAGDMFKFAQALQGGKILPKKWLEEALKAQPDSPGYGYGFGTGGRGAAAWFGHNGGAPGMNAEFRVFSGSGIMIVALANTDPPAASRLVEFFERRLPE